MMLVKPAANGASIVTEGGIAVRFRRQESLILWALLGHRHAHPDLLSEILWPCAATMPDAWINHIRVVMSRVRERLRVIGYDVKPNWSWGYSLVAK